VTGAGPLGRRITPAGRQRGRDVMAAWHRLTDGDTVAVGPADGTTNGNGHDSGPGPVGLRPMSLAPWSVDGGGREDGRELLSVENLSIHFGGVQALRDVRLRVRTGEVTGVIGPNGAGKSTLFNCLSGLLQPDAGTVTFDGAPLRGAPSVRARRGLGRTFQTPRLFRSLSVLDNLLFGCETADWSGHRYVFDPRLGRLPQIERAERIAALVGFRGDLSVPAGSLPFGDLRTVELARALCGAPSLLMLDEPASGLDADQAQSFVGLMRELGDMGLAVLLIEHDMALVMGLCKRITVLDFGQVIAEGTPEDVQRNETVVHAYLGRSAARA
jgi:ABC-type branched-subunit amino acid transport system ATPase component